MKPGRVQRQGGVRLALIDESGGRAALVGGPFLADPDPVRTVIADGWSRERLEAQITETVDLETTGALAPFAALARNVFALGKNYHDHALEFDRSGFNATQGGASAIPTHPQIFSKATTTLAGPTDDVWFATGTPVGVGVGFSPPRFLGDGDVVRISVNGLGELQNRFRTGRAT